MSSKRYEVTAYVFDKRRNLIAVAANTYTKTHPLQKHFAQKVGHPEREFLHAEIAALLKCKTKIPHTIKVFRYDNDGFYRCAKPCPICLEAIKAFGVQEIWYTDINHQMVQIKL